MTLGDKVGDKVGYRFIAVGVSVLLLSFIIFDKSAEFNPGTWKWIWNYFWLVLTWHNLIGYWFLGIDILLLILINGYSDSI